MARLIIILGYTLNSDCSIHPILKSRLDEALTIHKDGDLFLVCGKRPPEFINPNLCIKLTEADAMQEYLMKNGITENNIFKEIQSHTTLGNAFYSLEIIKNITPKNIIIISNQFHLPLVEYVFNKILGDKYFYTFHSCKNSSVSEDEINRWTHVIKNLIETFYPMLFANVKDGDIESIKELIGNQDNLTAFKLSLKALLNLSNLDEITII